MLARLGLTLCSLATSSAAIAMEGTRPAYTPPPPTVLGSGSLLQITFSLLLVLFAIVAVAWLLKRMHIAQQGTGNLLKVIGSVAVGQRERVVLVEVNDTWLLIGVGPGQIRTLHTLDKASDWQSSPAAPDAKFSHLLSSLIKPRATQEKA